MTELEWVDFLKKKTGRGRGVITGIGDDCAQVQVGSKKILLKSDLFIEGVHFKRRKVNYKTVGMRAVGRLLSDLAACGGVPKFIGVSAGIPAYVNKKSLEQIIEGILFYSKKYKFSLIGGDTSPADKLFLDVWGAGYARKCILRSTARRGDYIFITGRLGKRDFSLPFEPRIKESQNLVKNFRINAMIDISDGFIIDLYRVLKESKKGAVIFKENLPLTKGDSDLCRGEDYELIFTVSKDEPRLSYLKKKFYFVGRIENKKGLRFEKS